jgi:hypothetical protein
MEKINEFFGGKKKIVKPKKPKPVKPKPVKKQVKKVKK